MAVTITCPHCGAAGNAPDHIIGQTVRCSKCKQSFVAGGAPAAAAPPPLPAASAPPPPPAPVVEDYEEEPAARRRRRDEGDEYDDAPAPRRSVRGGSTMMDYVTFRRMITPIAIMAVFYIALVLAVLGSLGLMVFALLRGEFGGVFAGLLGLVIGPFVLRVYAELILVIFRINETLTDIRNMKEDRG